MHICNNFCIMYKILKSDIAIQKSHYEFEDRVKLGNNIANLFSCETSWLGRRVTAMWIEHSRVIRNVLRFNALEISWKPIK